MTEFMVILKPVNCELLGLSIDGVHAHIAWARSIKDNFGVEINFPIIADLNMAVARSMVWFSQGLVIPRLCEQHLSSILTVCCGLLLYTQ